MFSNPFVLFSLSLLFIHFYFSSTHKLALPAWYQASMPTATEIELKFPRINPMESEEQEEKTEMSKRVIVGSAEAGPTQGSPGSFEILIDQSQPFANCFKVEPLKVFFFFFHFCFA